MKVAVIGSRGLTVSNLGDYLPCDTTEIISGGAKGVDTCARDILNDVIDIIEVVAALIWDNDKFMICQRPANKARPLLWEFVGGKVEPGETKEQALIRECKEELDIILEVGEVFTEAVHEYLDITIRLTVFNAKIAEGVPKLIEHNDLKWITPDEIPQYEFCPADVGILKEILNKGI